MGSKSRQVPVDQPGHGPAAGDSLPDFGRLSGGHWLINCVTGFDDYSVCIGRYTSNQEATNALKKVVQAQEDGKSIYSMPLCTELDGQYLVEPGERQQWRVNPGCRVYF